MKSSYVFSNRRFQFASIVAGALSLLYVAANVFVIGGEKFIFDLNLYTTAPLAILSTLFALFMWRQMSAGFQNWMLWGGILFGWILWTIAEIIWIRLAMLGQDPYPSAADYFYIAGYIPMWIGLFVRIRTLPVKPSLSQQMAIGAISLGVILLSTIYIFIPIVQDYDSQRLLESVLNFVYPLFDLILLILVLYIFFTYGSGDYGMGWRLLLAGFISHSVSNLIFTYADWHGLYWPDQIPNLVSTIGVDTTYNFTYVFWMLGIYALSIVLRRHHIIEIDARPKLTSNAHILMFTQKDGIVVDVSQNYHRLFTGGNPAGKSLVKAIGLSAEQERDFRGKLLVKKKLTDEPVRIVGDAGQVWDGWLCGEATFDSQKEYSGANLVFYTAVGDDACDDDLSKYEKSMMLHVLTQCDSAEINRIKQLLLEYHLAYIKSFFNLAFREGGAGMSQSLLDEMWAASQRKGWRLQFNSHDILADGEASSLDVIKEALPALLNVARQFAARLTDANVVEAQMQAVHSKFGESIHKKVARYGS